MLDLMVSTVAAVNLYYYLNLSVFVFQNNIEIPSAIADSMILLKQYLQPNLLQGRSA
jgi:hypothetical protein